MWDTLQHLNFTLRIIDGLEYYNSLTITYNIATTVAQICPAHESSIAPDSLVQSNDNGILQHANFIGK